MRAGRRQLLAAAGAGLLSAPLAAWAKPSAGRPSAARAVRIVVPFAAGAQSDVLTRAIAQRVTEGGGPAFVIDNRPGGGGTIAVAAVKNAAPNGRTLLLAHAGTHAILPAMQPVAYDPQADFAALALLFHFPNFLAVPQRSAARSVRELVALAAATPGGISHGSQGLGTAGHLLGAMLQQQAGVPLVHVPYAGGGGPMHVDLVAGRLDLVFSTYASLKPHSDQGRVRLLALAAAERSALLSDLPTLREAGYPDVALDAWFGLVAPAGTPAPVLDVLNAAFQLAAQAPDLAQRFSAQGVTLAIQGPDALRRRIAEDRQRLARLARSLGRGG